MSDFCIANWYFFFLNHYAPASQADNLFPSHSCIRVTRVKSPFEPGFPTWDAGDLPTELSPLSFQESRIQLLCVASENCLSLLSESFVQLDVWPFQITWQNNLQINLADYLHVSVVYIITRNFLFERWVPLPVMWRLRQILLPVSNDHCIV